MTLFDDHDVAEELLPHGGSAVLFRHAVDHDEATEMMALLDDEIAWSQPTIRMYGKEMPQPRLVAWFGDPGARYSYSGTSFEPSPWTPSLDAARTICEDLAGSQFNSVLVNLYRDGSDSVAWHADDEPELGSEPTIASLSLGGVRRFHLKHRSTGDTVRVDLPAGSVLVMSGRCQAEWLHQISKTKKAVPPRINLTFREILTGVG